jgi:hypothetical protein
MGFPFDPFMSVQYYSLASKDGDTEADMALSKWFLCGAFSVFSSPSRAEDLIPTGAENCFSANEDLAYTFASKAATKGLASAEFAMGYYSELGIGTKKDLEAARKWYSKVRGPAILDDIVLQGDRAQAAAGGNADAGNRIKALEQSKASMSRAEHEAHAAALVRWARCASCPRS